MKFMKNCVRCNSQLNDEEIICPFCAALQPNPSQPEQLSSETKTPSESPIQNEQTEQTQRQGQVFNTPEQQYYENYPPYYQQFINNDYQ